MQLHPTRATFQVALAGAAVVALGVAARLPAVVGFGGAMLLSIAVGRALALATVTRIRASGFEMVWLSPKRVSRSAPGGEIRLACELRNRGGDDAFGVNVRAIASSMLGAQIEPESIELPRGARVRLDITVRPERVGRWGLHGIALEVRGTPLGGEGLYEVPLMFANPHGIEVLPETIQVQLTSPRGGRSRRSHEAGRPSRIAGDGDALRELRDLVPGDPFKRIAWKASARRGRLLVRDMDRDERDIVWLLLDGSVELWAGAPGTAPLDQMVEAVASLGAAHLHKGDHVGLVVSASRVRTWLPPSSGAGHVMKLAAALTSAANMVDDDRSEIDEAGAAALVSEHLRPLDPRGLADIGKRDLDGLAARAESMRARAPFSPRVPQAKSTREQRLRHYLAAFGIEVPPRLDGEGARSEVTLLAAMSSLLLEKKRPSIIHVFAPMPRNHGDLARAIRKLRAKHVEVRWTLPDFLSGLSQGEQDTVGRAVADAVRLRAQVGADRAKRALGRLGVKVLTPRGLSRAGRKSPAPPATASEPT